MGKPKKDKVLPTKSVPKKELESEREKSPKSINLPTKTQTTSTEKTNENELTEVKKYRINDLSNTYLKYFQINK